MRILVISNMYPPHHYGGYELSCRDVVDRWRAEGHEVTVLTTTMRVAGVTDPDPPGVRRELQFYWDDHVLTSPPVWRRFLMERSNHLALRRALDEVVPDVVSVWNMGALSLGLITSLNRRGLPVVYVVSDDWILYAPDLDAWSRLFPRRRWAGKAITALTGVPAVAPSIGEKGTYLFISERTQRRTARAFPHSGLVYSGFSLTDFPLTPPRDAPWQWRVLYVGRIDERKGIASVISALPHLPPEATLTIDGAGDESHRAEFLQLAKSLGVADRITWQVSKRATLRDAYRGADVFVFSSIWEEPFGLTPLEAMACATPVVATGVGGSGEFLRDGGNCLLYPPGDAAGLAAAVERLAGDADLRRRLVDEGLRTAEELSIDRYADALLQWHVAAAGGYATGEPAPRRLAR